MSGRAPMPPGTPPGPDLPAVGEVVVIDGGLATELEARGHDLSDRLWSARLLRDDPAAIEAVHAAYFGAGARVATTASYQATVEGFAAVGVGRDDALALVRRSVELARRARDRAASRAAAGGDLRPRLVAGSVGPYGAMLADGSEYTGGYDLTEAELVAFHRPRAEALLEAGADLLAFETIPSVAEGAALVRLLDELPGARAWLSFQCRDGERTARGEPIEEAVAIAAGHPRIVAVGVNCTAPGDLPSLLARIAGVTDLPRIAYPNAGRGWDAESRTWLAPDGAPFDPATTASWRGLGATWLGGCCGVGPSGIAALASRLAG
ncbi:MAG TPA: homocysteine S-methyltransferase [Candidatus Limnocylindrales bacterium]|nr:homocysteine S-methyltransferase [Candidatus Limnocylindrales bacterium]